MAAQFKEVVRGSKPGTHYVRYRHQPTFQYLDDGHLVARPELLKPTTGVEKVLDGFKRACIGDPLSNERAIHERLTKLKGLAILSSDALSSVAYATEEILLVLVLAGTGVLGLSLPVAAAIVGLLLIVGASYRQTIGAYPNGGGSYIVASDNLGTMPGLIAGASLLVDYVLTVAVSVSAGVAALTSAFPNLTAYTVEIGVAFTLLIMVGNLRGIRESGNIFALPTYVFIAGILALIAVGMVRLATGMPAPHPLEVVKPVESLGIFLILRAFASGCTAMTGVEAISNGVPAFKPPEAPNARTTLTWMVGILAVMFTGITILARALNITPNDQETVVSQIAAAVFGRNGMYYLIQIATMLILVLAANTSFADFPRLSSILARDGFMPHQFAHRGDRLAFSYGIVVLTGLSILLLAAFGGQTDALIPLYAVGVFTAFTLSQAGMVVHHKRVRQPGWRTARLINGFGAVLTGIVTVVIAATKFIYGAWIVLLLIPLLIWLMLAIKRHYAYVDRVMNEPVHIPSRLKNRIIVPIAKLNAVSERTMAYARSIAPQGDDVIAVHVSMGVEQSDLVEHWKDWSEQARLVCIESPYRSLIKPLLAYVDQARREVGDGMVTVVLPELVPAHWYEHLLHNHAGLRLKAALLFRPNTVVASVPYWPEGKR
ncbi:MAG TPA: APC family permease [Chloroflexota bacterium]|nr:APC family permease [Chloroflexota bacterium]